MSNFFETLQKITKTVEIPCANEDWKKLESVAEKINKDMPDKNITPNQLAAFVIHMALEDGMLDK